MSALCAGAAAVAALAGCSSHPRSAAADGRRALAAGRAAGTVVEHWGSFFGGPVGNFDTQTLPTTVLLPDKVTEVGTSNSTEYALLANGSVYAWGLGTQGQLGDGSLGNSFIVPVRVRFPAGVKIASIPTDAMPYDTALAVDTSGRVWGWGANGGGELCLGNQRMYSTPVELPLTHVTTLAGASNHAVYDTNGTVDACGQNVAGDLGTGSTRNATTAVAVAGLNGADVTTLVASFANSGALLSDGTYYDWGYNEAGQLGDGHPGHSSDVPVRVPLPDPVVQVAQGGSLWNNGQSLVKLSDGSVWAWGDNWAGQLGTGSRKAHTAPVHIDFPAGVTYQLLATGSATSYAISTTGKVYAWGVSHVGQAGTGQTRTVIQPVIVASDAATISATANNVVISGPEVLPTRKSVGSD
jgi:alpha-tubulin suppressor-like RCC1 family protein